MSPPYAYQAGPSSFNSTLVSSTWYRYEAARSFDLDDDLEFCPGLLSHDEMLSISTVYSDRSSSSSGSPNSSPLQMQIRPSSSSTSPYLTHTNSPANSFSPNVKPQLPSSSSRQRNAIPIVNPQTGMRVSSPPLLSNTSGTQPNPIQLSKRHW